jgi:hypothetical protein
MAGARDDQRACIRIQHQVEGRRGAARLELAQQAAEPLQDLRGRDPVERVRPQPAAQLAHDRRGVEAAAHDVADGHAEPSIREQEGVVPVAAELGRGRRKVAAGQRQRRQLREPRDEAALERIGEAALALGQAAGDREGSTVAGTLEQLSVLPGEVARGEGPDVHDADHPALHQQGDPQQGAQTLLAQNRVDDLGLVDVLDLDRLPGSSDAPREPLADRNAHSPLDLLLEALGGPRH